MMKKSKRIFSLLLVILLIGLQGIFVFAEGEEPSDSGTPKPVLAIIAPSGRVTIGKTLSLSVNTEDPVKWSSSDTSVATVDKNGTVSGVKVGPVTITAETADSTENASVTIYVVRRNMPWRTLLEKHNILSYQYNFEGDYYYTNDKKAWQKNFGFNFAYDMVAPILLFEYDYVRVFFTYGGYDWMIQMWKGQYGMVFYGSEVGVYLRPTGGKEATKYSHYNCAGPDNYLKIGSTLYHQDTDGRFKVEYERPYEEHWWCTGFVPGHLRDTTPCDELRTVTHITLKDAEMAKLFTDGLKECGFGVAYGKDRLRNDTFFMDGKDVYLQWQNISEAANSHMVQAGFWSAVGINGFFLGIFALIFGMIAMIPAGLIGLIILI